MQSRRQYAALHFDCLLINERMGNNMKKILESKYGLLIFSLVSGMGYFVLLLLLFANVRYSYLIGIFFCPAVVCGSALCIVKYVKALREQEKYDKIKRIIVIHSALIVFSVIVAVLYFVFK